jgi:ribosomal protein S18 acetylase RimI-like enzyme
MRIDPIDQKHIRKDFINQHPSLQNYFRNVAMRDVSSGMSQCFVLTDGDDIVRGYYTLSSISVDTSDWDQAFKKNNKLVYDTIPGTLIGKLAVDSQFQGKKYGTILLFHALWNAAISSNTVGSAAIVVDPIDDKATRFYQKYDFQNLTNTKRMFMSMKKAKLIKSSS